MRIARPASRPRAVPTRWLGGCLTWLQPGASRAGKARLDGTTGAAWSATPRSKHGVSIRKGRAARPLGGAAPGPQLERSLEGESAAYAMFWVATAITAARQRRKDDDRWVIDDYWAHSLAAVLWLTANPPLRDPLQRILARLEANPWPAALLAEVVGPTVRTLTSWRGCFIRTPDDHRYDASYPATRWEHHSARTTGTWTVVAAPNS